MSPQRVLDLLSDLNPDAVLLDNMDAALIGIGYIGNNDPVAVYSRGLMQHQFLISGFSETEADEYYHNNCKNVVPTANTPVIVDDLQGGR
jgi:hypothetical protein